MAQFSQGLCFDLADAFAGDGEVLADLFKRVLAAGVAEAKTHLDSLFLTWRQRCKNFVGYLT